MLTLEEAQAAGITHFLDNDEDATVYELEELEDYLRDQLYQDDGGDLIYPTVILAQPVENPFYIREDVVTDYLNDHFYENMELHENVAELMSDVLVEFKPKFQALLDEFAAACEAKTTVYSGSGQDLDYKELADKVWAEIEAKETAETERIQNCGFKTLDYVNYHAIIGGPVTSTGHQIVSGPYIGCGDELVAYLSNKSGCVSIEALSQADKQEEEVIADEVSA